LETISQISIIRHIAGENMVITVTLNPAADRTVKINNFEIGSVNRIVSERTDAGGKGINVSKTIRSLNGKTKALGIAGGRTGLYITQYLDETGIENEFVKISGESRTNLKIVDNIRKTITDINEPGPLITGEDVERFENILFKHIDKGSIFVFSGSVPGSIDRGIYGKWIRRLKKEGIRTILDADGDLLKYGIVQGPYLCKPNVRELETLVGRRIESPAEAGFLGKKILKENGIEVMVISLGEKGALFINRNDTFYASALEVEVKSTVGAGDAMVAALAYCIDMGYSMDEMIRLSMASGTAAVMSAGTKAPSYELIKGLADKITYRKL